MDKGKARAFTVLLLVLAGISVDRWYEGPRSQESHSSSGDKLPIVTMCYSDWKSCADNEDLAKHWFKWSEVQQQCKEGADQQSVYGTPEWPWFPFSRFYAGRTYIDSGIAFAVENDARFSNAFGTMTKVTIQCAYDLNKYKVVTAAVIWP